MHHHEYKDKVFVGIPRNQSATLANRLTYLDSVLMGFWPIEARGSDGVGEFM